jgi:hypothetical protein
LVDAACANLEERGALLSHGKFERRGGALALLADPEHLLTPINGDRFAKEVTGAGLECVPVCLPPLLTRCRRLRR